MILRYICCLNPRFGSRICHYGACDPTQITRKLNCSEGTSLILLARAAVEAADQLIAEHIAKGEQSRPAPFRLVFVLNTDGEASDGRAAGVMFKEAYNRWQGSFPNMAEARTFVLGIGDDHDQRVLGAMSVGEASYYNYPDASLSETLCRDTERNIIPEVMKVKGSLKITFNSGRSLQCAVKNNMVDVSDIRVFPDETSVSFSDGQIYSIHDTPRKLSIDDLLYHSLLIRDLEIEVLDLAKQINTELGRYISGGNKAFAETCESKIASLRERRLSLVQDIGEYYATRARTKSLSHEFIDENSLEERVSAVIAGSSEGSASGLGLDGRRSVYALMLKLREAAAADPNQAQVSESTTPELDRLNALEAVLDLCFGGSRITRLGGKMSREIGMFYISKFSLFLTICLQREITWSSWGQAGLDIGRKRRRAAL